MAACLSHRALRTALERRSRAAEAFEACVEAVEKDDGEELARSRDLEDRAFAAAEAFDVAAESAEAATDDALLGRVPFRALLASLFDSPAAVSGAAEELTRVLSPMVFSRAPVPDMPDSSVAARMAQFLEGAVAASSDGAPQKKGARPLGDSERRIYHRLLADLCVRTRGGEAFTDLPVIVLERSWVCVCVMEEAAGGGRRRRRGDADDAGDGVDAGEDELPAQAPAPRASRLTLAERVARVGEEAAGPGAAAAAAAGAALPPAAPAAPPPAPPPRPPAAAGRRSTRAGQGS
jgi:hypothetical protein